METNVKLPANRAERRRSSEPKIIERVGITREERQRRKHKHKIAKESRKKTGG